MNYRAWLVRNTWTNAGSASIWDVQSNKKLRDLPKIQGEIFAMDASGTGHVAMVGRHGGFWLWHPETGLRQIKGHTQLVNMVKFSNDGSQMLTAELQNRVWLWQTQDPNQPIELKGHSAPIYCLAFSRDGRYAASGSYDQSINIWDLQNGQSLMRLPVGIPIHQVAFAANGRQLFALTEDRKIQLWDLITGSPLAIFGIDRDSPHADLELSPSGTQMAVTLTDSQIRLIDIDDFPFPANNPFEAAWYQTLLDRSLFQMGYRLGGIRLFPHKPLQMHSNNPSLPKSYERLRPARPKDETLANWLMGPDLKPRRNR